VPAGEVQQGLRRAFDRWGCPGWLRVDNGIPWGTPGGLPSELSLWAVGLGVRVHWNEPYRPQQNGVVESTQGTSQRWAEPGDCADIGELRRRLEREDWLQREHNPSIARRCRRQAYPGLCHTGRGYCRGWEEQVWDLTEALRFLAEYRVRRKVSRRGQVSLYHRLVQVGPEQGGAWVYVQMDPATVEWVIWDAAGQELRRRPAPQFSRQAIMGLAVSRS
jgi:hypothetical protein